MKRRTIIALIAAALLIIAGGMILVLGLSFDGGPAEQEEKTYIVKEAFESIRVETGICNVVLEKTDGEFRVVVPETERISYAVIVSDGVLKISAVDLHHWYDFVGVNLGEMTMKVYLPESQYDILRIDTDSGDIALPNTLSFATAELFSDTGEIRIAAAATERITTGTATGDIHVIGSSPATLNVATNTGDVELNDLNCVSCVVKTITGEIDLKHITCQSLECTSDTGDMEMERSIAQDYIKAISDTGDVELMECDAQTITVQTETGDISGMLLSPKEFFARTDTGRERIADHSGTITGTCHITSDTGDITFGYTK